MSNLFKTVLIKPVPYADPSRLVIVSMAAPDGGDFGVPLAEFEQLQTRLQTTVSIANYLTQETPICDELTRVHEITRQRSQTSS